MMNKISKPFFLTINHVAMMTIQILKTNTESRAKKIGDGIENKIKHRMIRLQYATEVKNA
jgi:hypothetical protein